VDDIVDVFVASVFAGVVSDVIADAVVDGKLVEIVDVDVFFSFFMHLVGATSISISGITAMLVVAFCAHFCS
jgi:phosphoglucomutase